MIETHPCAADGCSEACARGFFMCIRHWRMVPMALRRELRSAWAAFSRGCRLPGREAVRKTVNAVREAEARAVAAVRDKELRKLTQREELQHGMGF